MVTDICLPEGPVAGRGRVKKPIMLMLILNGKITPTLLISIISGTTEGEDRKAFCSNLSLSRGISVGSEGIVADCLPNGQSPDSSFPLLDATQMEYDETLSSLWKMLMH